MSTPRKRPARPSCEALEIRSLLSGLPFTATWVGQDRNDFVGRSPLPGPNGVQDIRIALADLPVTRAVTAAEVRGFGGGAWTYNGSGVHWAAALRREPGSPTADLFFESDRVEIGRQFSARLWFDDGSTSLVYFAGGVADPTLRMPEFASKPTWIGQDGSDRVGRDASVGPDGLQDAVIALGNLPAKVEITRIDVRGPAGPAWQSGANPGGLPNAELIRDPADPTRASLFIQPDRDLGGMPLTLTISFANATTELVEVVAGPTDPAKPVSSPPVVPIRDGTIAARWLGQTDDPIAGPGAAGVALEGLPPGRAVIGAALSGPGRGASWAFKADPGAAVAVEAGARVLAFRRDPNDPGRASIAFPPEGNERGAAMTLRLNYDDGSVSIVRFEGGPSDSRLRAPLPAASMAVARPGDDLQSLADAFGSVRLSGGVYELDRPLVLNRAVAITADPGATLRFSQPSDAAPWPAAIAIHHGNTTLNGFAVRFAGPVRWDWSVPYWPAVIGTTDTRQPAVGTTKVGLVLTNLDLEGPPASSTGGGAPEFSANLANLVSAEDGRIVGNRLRGGTIRVRGGPWEIAGNTYLGAMPGTWAYDVFSMSHVHDIRVVDNVASPLPGSGKTYRFLVMTQDGSNIRVERNRVEGLGPRDDDARPHPNTPEVILTEAYRIQFEGLPRSLSPDGTILQIPDPQGRAIRSGDVVAVLSGPLSGQWRRVSQVIDPRTLVLDRPLPTNQPIGAVSVSSGFVDLVVAENRVDVRGGSEAAPLVLAGAHFGAQVRGNHLLGGAGSRLAASSSEWPVHWGWTHTPQFGVRFASNVIEDVRGGLEVGPVRYPHSKSSRGRTYLDAEIRDNLFAWSPAFFSRTGASAAPPAVNLGHFRTIDPLETRVVAAGNLVKLPPGVAAGKGIDAVNAIYNGAAIASQAIPLPPQPLAAPGGLRLVNDTGISATDRLTADARLAFDRPGWAVGFEYRVEGQSGHRPVASADGFLPSELLDGPVTVLVRAIDDYGRIGPEASFSFTLDTTPPGPVTPRLGPGQDTGISDTDRLTRIPDPTLLSDGEAGDTLVLVLLPGGRELDRRLGLGTLRVGQPLPDGSHQLAVRRIDAAGNATLGPPLTITIDATPPAPVVARLGPGQDTGISSTDGLTRVNNPTFPAVIDDADLLILLRDGLEVHRINGSGSLRAGGPLPDGSYTFVVRRMDAAGNVADGPPAVVTIDTTPPGPVAGLVHAGNGLFRFQPMAGAVDYTFRVGNGPVAPLAGATSFRVKGLPFEPTPVVVRAIDAAGNLGAEAVLSASMPAPLGSWIGQRPGVDLVGPSATQAVPDGIQDVALALTGLPSDRSIISAEVRGWGSGIWQYNVAGGPYWKAAFVQAPGGDRAEVFIQPYQFETGRPYFVRLHFSDGTTVGLTIDGGPVNPTLRTVPAPAPLAALLPAVAAELPGTSAGRVPAPSADPIPGRSAPGPILGAPSDPRSTPADEADRLRPATWRDRLAMIRATQLERIEARRRALEEARRAPRIHPAPLRPVTTGLRSAPPRPGRR